MAKCFLFDIDIIERDEYPSFPKLPNHALLKLTDYYKKKGYDVVLVYKASMIPLIYSPKNMYIGSALYSGNLLRFKRRLSVKTKYKNQLKIENIHIGTPTDSCPKTDLPGIKCDYTLYDKMLKENPKIRLEWYPVNVGFLTRGCKRHCNFCVNRDKSEIVEVNTLDEIYQKEGYPIELLDDNLLASDNATKHLNDIADFAEKHNITFRLRNGFDLRGRLPKEKLEAIQRCNKYFPNGFHMAWDITKNTYIFNHIQQLTQYVSGGRFTCYMLTGIDIHTKKELYEDLLALFYRYYLLKRCGVRPYIALYEDDRELYHNPYWHMYKVIKTSYGFQKQSQLVHLKRQLPLSKQKTADEIINILGEHSWLVTQNVRSIVDDPNMNDKFKEIADIIGVKHYDLIN